MKLDSSTLFREDLAELSAYAVPDATGLVKLDAMENPYGLPEDLAREIGTIAARAELNRYPDPAACVLKARLYETQGIPPDMGLLLGNGSDELIQILALAVARPQAVILGVEPSFVMYRLIARFCRVEYVGVPLAEDFGLDLAATRAAIARAKPALVFLAYPNNPTGNLFEPAQIEAIIEANPGLTVIDEAYFPFARKTFMERLADFPRLMVMRTLSKLGLAGLRLGYLVGRPELIRELDKLRLPYNVNVLTQSIAARVLAAAEVLDTQAARIREERARLARRLGQLPGVEVFPSDANFLLFRVAQADEVFEGLKRHGILIKNLSSAHPRLRGCLRVTVGTREQNDAFLSSLQDCL